MLRLVLLPFPLLFACQTATGDVAPTTPTSTALVAPVSTDAPSGPEATDTDVDAVATADPPSDPAADTDAAETTTYAVYQLRRGETLAHFARWSELPVETIAEASGLDLAGTYPVGTEIRVPVTPETRATLEERREEHRTTRIDGYLASRGGAIGTDFWTVHSGETAWSIADQSQHIPLWLLEAYNPTADLDHLRPGEQLMVPVLADSVADGE